MIDGLTGVVLAGGRSSRFGSNKALAEWRGASLIEAAVKSLREVTPRVLIVAKDVASLKFLQSEGTDLIKDRFDEHHPLGGLHTALENVATSHAFVCACDMPFIQPGLIEALWAARADYDAVVPVWQGVRQPLFGVYSKTCAGLVRGAIAAGERGIAPLFDCLRTRFFLDTEILGIDPEGHSFTDIDTREEYARMTPGNAS